MTTFRSPDQVPLALAGALLWIAGFVTFFGVGYQGSDDSSYMHGAIGWLTSFPYIGESHWTLRHPITMPMAGVFAFLGVSEGALKVAASAFLVGSILLLALFYARGLARGPTVGLAVLLTSPGLLVLGSYVNTDAPELFYVLSSVALLLLAIDRRHTGLMFAAGVLAGVAFLTRQTSIALFLAIGLTLLFRPVVKRRMYLAAAIGASMVLAGEWLWLTLSTANPLYRLSVDFHHDPVDRLAEIAKVRARGGLIDKEGCLTINFWIDPWLNLLVSQKFGLAFWLAVPAAVAVLRSKLSDKARTFAIFTGTLALCWIATIAYNPKLYLVPRYFILPYVIACVMIGWWVTLLVDAGRRRLAACMVAFICCSNLVLLALENIAPRAAWALVAESVRAHPGERIHADPVIANRISDYLRLRGIREDRIARGAAWPGSLVVVDEQGLESCRRGKYCDSPEVRAFSVAPEWQLLEVHERHNRLGALLVERFLHFGVVSGDVAERLSRKAGIKVYRVPSVNS